VQLVKIQNRKQKKKKNQTEKIERGAYLAVACYRGPASQPIRALTNLPFR
jgi:hypothetical protein